MKNFGVDIKVDEIKKTVYIKATSKIDAKNRVLNHPTLKKHSVEILYIWKAAL